MRRVLTTAAAERQTIAQQTDRDARRAAMQALHQRTEANLEAVLDANQRATLDRMQAVREARRTEHANRPVATPATPATPARRGR